MRFAEVTLAAPAARLAELDEFYAGTLGLSRTGHGAGWYEVGETRLRFEAAPGEPFYHFALLVPDLCNDMHDCSVATGDAWLKAHVVPLLHSPELRRGVVFVVFDEGTSNTGGGGRVEALALGPTVRRGSRFARATNHYGLLRTIEDAWDLPRLGFSRTGRPIGDIWK